MRPSWKNGVAGCGSLEVFLDPVCFLHPCYWRFFSPHEPSQPSVLSALRFPSYLGPAALPAAICMSTHQACWYPHRCVTSVCLQHAVSKAPRFSHSSGVTPHSSRFSLVPISKRNRKTPVLNLLLPSASHCSAKLWGMGRPMGGLWTAKR